MRNRHLLLLSYLFLLSGCNLVITQTYHSNLDGSDRESVALGLVEGQSCQTSALYLISYGESASTQGAIADVKSRMLMEKNQTQFLRSKIRLGDKSLSQLIQVFR
ncbi:hypothetical protein Sps_00671 [Shewanella psychrophila]|uniref:Uncharacterized protein n=1 Tax=Shewanella psychrophila TaxID=225848 RepID=A0A1S6HJZ8_9GAMM|nr:hypothetical protein [Shewanella psychrophila]AQS35865.1 hypothetical protein Sps_00671 [Shewanella psychrophila]